MSFPVPTGLDSSSSQPILPWALLSQGHLQHSVQHQGCAQCPPAWLGWCNGTWSPAPALSEPHQQEPHSCWTLIPRGTPGTSGTLGSGDQCTKQPTPPPARQCSHWSLKICTRGHPYWSQISGTSLAGTRGMLLHCTQAVMSVWGLSCSCFRDPEFTAE